MTDTFIDFNKNSLVFIDHRIKLDYRKIMFFESVII